MNVNGILESALSGILPTAPGKYKGDADKFIIFDILDDRGALYADDEPQIDRVIVRVKLYVPVEFNYLSTKSRIRRALFRAGFTYPVIEEMTEDDYKCIIFECSIDGASETEE